MPLNFSLEGMVDLRQPILGDSFGWEALEPAAAKKSVVIHHSASPNNQDGYDIAAYHTGHNGWGGIGYHFVITHDDYPGRAGATNPGAQIQYVGDLLTWRAHVLNSNPGRVGVCLVGNFENEAPGPNQLRLARQLIDYFIAKNNMLPSLNFYSQVTGHGLIPGQQTSCPGYNTPSFAAWFGYLTGGAYPESLYAPPTPPPVAQVPTVTVDIPAPVVTSTVPNGQTNAPVIPVTVTPGYVATFQEIHETRVVLRDGAYAVDAPNSRILEATRPNLHKGTPVEVWGYFSFNGDQFARTKYAVEHNTWTGIPLSFLQIPDVPDPTDPLENTDLPAQLDQSAAGLSDGTQQNLRQVLAELVAIVVSPLIRLLGVKKGK